LAPAPQNQGAEQLFGVAPASAPQACYFERTIHERTLSIPFMNRSFKICVNERERIVRFSFGNLPDYDLHAEEK